jgi:cytochrome c oxidase subunit 2
VVRPVRSRRRARRFSPNSAAPPVTAPTRKGRGPNLQGVFGKPVQLEDGRTVTADENYLRECILDPGTKRVKGFQPIMPTFQGLVSEEQVNALVAYIKSIAAAKGEAVKSASTAAPPAQTNAQTNRSQVQ